MRKLTSFLFVSLDGVVEAPNRFVRSDVFEDLLLLIGETIAEQDTVLLGRQMYDAPAWETNELGAIDRNLVTALAHAQYRLQPR